MPPAPHPAPPDHLPDRDLPLVLMSGPWFRLHNIARDALYFGREPIFRFNDPDARFGVMYMGETLACAFIETFDRIETANPDHKCLNVVAWSALESRGVASVETAIDLRLVDITGPGLRRIGADGRLASTDDYDLTRRWSRALHDHPSQPDGIRYRSRHDPSLFSAAVFERARPKLTARARGSLASPPFHQELAQIMETYQFSLVPTRSDD
ncbi:MAG: RES family NAD+ phosphorylase [Chloroflexi bacterium]|nr:RES family NAD+ phosphorylase [Chloroflexota bacterium]